MAAQQRANAATVDANALAAHTPALLALQNQNTPQAALSRYVALSVPWNVALGLPQGQQQQTQAAASTTTTTEIDFWSQDEHVRFVQALGVDDVNVAQIVATAAQRVRIRHR